MTINFYMKDLINKIKHNRLPKELLYLRGLVKSCEKHKHTEITDYKTGFLIYRINYEDETITFFRTNTYLVLNYLFSYLTSDSNSTNKLMKDSLIGSIYSNYLIV